MSEQISIFGEEEQRPSECCYKCAHFAEFKEPRLYDDFGVYGMCFKSYNKNGSMYAYPIYIPDGSCKQYKKAKRSKHYE